MNFDRFIANNFLSKERGSMSAPLVKIAVASIAVGVLVMIMSVSILRGFQNEITRKVSGFGSHIVVKNLQPSSTIGATPFETDSKTEERIKQVRGVTHLQSFATKGGMAKTEEQIHGIILKGMSRDYDTSFFAENIVEGRLFRFAEGAASNEIIVSSTITNKLMLKVGDKLRTYFWQNNNYRARAFTIVGIYNTDLTDFDQHYIIGDLAQVQRLNEWNPNEVEGYELTVDNFDHLKHIAYNVLSVIDYDLTCTTVVEQNPALFAWLNLLNSNIFLIIGIMILVCVVAIISALLIMIFEKASTIGLLKTIGATNRSVRNIFLIKSAHIIGQGILIGDAIAFALCWLQYRFHIIHLDSESYSMSFVPIELNAITFLLISLGSLAVCLAALLAPAAYIARIEPAKSLRFQ